MTRSPHGLCRVRVMTDNFNGDTPHLIRCIEALLNLDAKGALAPHGIGGHARTLLEAAAVRLAAGPALPDPLREALHLIASTTTDPGAREEAQRALGVNGLDAMKQEAASTLARMGFPEYAATVAAPDAGVPGTLKENGNGSR